MKIILVGEAWGAREAKFSHALVGPSGRELTIEMAKAELAPFLTLRCRKCKELVPFLGTFHCPNCNEFIDPNPFNLMQHWKQLKEQHGIHVTNVFNAHPPEICLDCSSHNTTEISPYRYKCNDCGSRKVQTNDLGWFFGSTKETAAVPWKASKKSPGTHLKAEFSFHLDNLYNEINLLRPNLVIAMGNAACWALLEQPPSISNMRGYVDWSKRLSVKVLPTNHSAHVLRNPAFRTTCIADYRKAKVESQFPEVRRPERWINIIDPTPEGIQEGYNWFQKPATAYSIDIETYKNLISMVGFARSKSDALVIVFRDEENKTNPNYWPTPELEFEAWKLVQFGLATPQEKIFQNGVFDLSYFLRMGLPVKNFAHDTMLWHHSWLPELPKSLGYLGSLYCADIAWKRMRNRESLKKDE